MKRLSTKRGFFLLSTIILCAIVLLSSDKAVGAQAPSQLSQAAIADLTFTQHTIDNEYEGAAHYNADLDNDGDLDIIALAYINEPLVWYENDGYGGFTDQHIIDLTFDIGDSVFAADLNGDGYKDVIAASGTYDTVAWWENNGDRTFSAQQVIDSSFVSAISVFSADMDNDNDSDVICASLADMLSWWENDGSGNFPAEHPIIEYEGSAPRSIFVDDLDGDGDRDILRSAGNSDHIGWWENQGKDDFVYHLIEYDFNGAFAVYIADIDQDGMKDILATAYLGHEIAWWHNYGGGNFSTKFTIDNAFDTPLSIYPADMDNDSDLDIVGASYYGEAAWWDNNGYGSFAGKQTIHTSNFIHAMSAADINNDGHMDVIDMINDQELAWWEQAGVTDTNPPAAIANLVASPGSTLGSVNLSWTAPGDDGNTGTAAAYIVRYSASIIDDETKWSLATDVPGEPPPATAGTPQSMLINGLTPGATYYFAIKTQDEALNVSGLSNSPDAQAAVISGRAMWVWYSVGILENEATDRQYFYNFLAAPHGISENKISTVFMYIPDEYLTEVSKKNTLHNFLEQADSKGINVHYLSPGNGTPIPANTWVTSSDRMLYGMDLISKVIQFNQEEATNEARRFRGIHLDIEPAENDDWDTNKLEYWSAFEGFLSWCHSEIEQYNAGAHPEILFGIDLVTYQPWYGDDVDSSGVEDYKELFAYVDFITTMDYSDHTNNRAEDFIVGSYGLATRTNSVVTYARSIGKHVVIGIETLNLLAENNEHLEAWMTFYEEGWKPMEDELSLLTDYYLDHSGLSGIALHNYASYGDLQEFGSVPEETTTILDEVIYMNQGETQVLNTVLDSLYKIHFVIRWEGSTVETQLIDPDLNVITPEDADTDPNIDHYAGSNYEVYILTYPMQGNWQAQLYGADLPAGGENVNVDVFASHMKKVYLPITIRHEMPVPFCETLFTDDFSTDKGWINESNGTVYRDPINNWLFWDARRIIPMHYYYPINASSDAIQLDLRFKVTGYNGNGLMWFGLAENQGIVYPNVIGIDRPGIFFGPHSNTAINFFSVYSDRTIYDRSALISYQGLNIWQRAILTINQSNWSFVLRDDNGALVNQMSGVLPRQHSTYNYVMLMFNYGSGWEYMTGMLDDVIVKGCSNP